jgi:hypothetical protein
MDRENRELRARLRDLDDLSATAGSRTAVQGRL